MNAIESISSTALVFNNGITLKEILDRKLEKIKTSEYTFYISEGDAIKKVRKFSYLIKMHFSAPPAIQLKKENLIQALSEIILKAHVSCGWKIPQENVIGLLIDQLIKRLYEDDCSFNAAEIEYSIRTFGPDIDIYGACMNVGLIAECIKKYTDTRSAILRELSSLYTEVYNTKHQII